MNEHDSDKYLNEVKERWAYNNEIRQYVGEEEYDRTVNVEQQTKNFKKVIQFITWEEYEIYSKQPWANDLEEFLEK